MKNIVQIAAHRAEEEFCKKLPKKRVFWKLMSEEHDDCRRRHILNICTYKGAAEA